MKRQVILRGTFVLAHFQYIFSIVYLISIVLSLFPFNSVFLCCTVPLFSTWKVYSLFAKAATHRHLYRITPHTQLKWNINPRAKHSGLYLQQTLLLRSRVCCTFPPLRAGKCYHFNPSCCGAMLILNIGRLHHKLYVWFIFKKIAKSVADPCALWSMAPCVCTISTRINQWLHWGTSSFHNGHSTWKSSY